MSSNNDYKNVTKDTYNSIAEALSTTYDDYFNACVKDEADEFLSYLSFGETVLDAGCGSGTHSKYFKEKGYKPFGVDISSEMVKICKAQDLTVIEADLENLNLTTKFDAIWAHTSLIHFPKNKIPSIVLNLESYLKEGGIMFIALRYGETEGFEGKGDEALLRWFSNFHPGEFNTYVPDSLLLLHERVTEFKGRKFINLLYKKL